VARSAFLVDVASLRRRPGQPEGLTARGTLSGLHTSAAGVPAGAEVSVDVVIEAIEGGIVARGTAQAAWEGECRRCLTPVGGWLRAELDELFVAGAEPGETWPIKNDQLDLGPVAREALILALPLAPLCREDCAGLCAVCGSDRNAGDCGCAPVQTDPRWSVLDRLREDF